MGEEVSGGGAEMRQRDGEVPGVGMAPEPGQSPHQAPSDTPRRFPLSFFQVFALGVAVAMLLILYFGMDPIIQCSKLQADLQSGIIDEQQARAGLERVSGVSLGIGERFGGD